MVEQNKFTLPQNLEALLGKCNGTSQALEIAREKPSVDDVETREALSEIFQDPRYLSMAPASLVGDLGVVKNQTYQTLDAQLDNNTYKAGMNFYKGTLDKEITAQMYGNLITKEGIITKESSKELKEVAGKLALAEAIEKALQKGDVKKAVALVDRLMDKNQKARMMYNDVNTGAAYERFKESIVADVEEMQRAQAYNVLTQGKLYSEIDTAMVGTEYGKAKSFMAAYGAYGTQQQKNKQIAEAEAKAEKAKKAA